MNEAKVKKRGKRAQKSIKKDEKEKKIFIFGKKVLPLHRFLRNR